MSAGGSSALEDVCVVLPGEYVRQHHVAELRTLLEGSSVDVGLVAIDETGPSLEADTPHSIERLTGAHVRKFLRALVSRQFDLLYVEEKVAQVLAGEQTAEARRADLLRKRSLSEVDALADAERLYFTPETDDGITYEFPDDAVDAIVARTDVVVLMGFTRILRGRILDEPAYGVLSWHPSDIRRYRGRPAPFWQFVNDEDTVGLTLQRLTETLDGGEIVVCEHADVSECDTFFEYHLAVTELYGSTLLAGIERLRDPDWEPEALAEDELGELTYEADANKWSVVLPALAKNVRGRYFG